MVNYCCVDGCSNKSKKQGVISFLSFPKNEQARKKWLEAANLSSDIFQKYKEVRVSFKNSAILTSKFSNFLTLLEKLAIK